MEVTARPAWQTILLAAAGIGQDEFTEADLTVAVWKLAPQQFGLRGYNCQHPDHKRVSTEIMGQRKHNVVYRGFLVRVGKGTFKLRITAEGKKVAARIMQDGPAPKHTRSGNGHDDWDKRLLKIAKSNAFQQWLDNPRKPTVPDGVDTALAPCGGLAKYEAIQAEIKWRLQSGECQAPLYANVLSDIHDFLTAMWNRFGGLQ